MNGIIGAVIGDIVGSLHESFNAGPIKPKYNFKLFTKASCMTDDSICTTAVAKWLLEDKLHTHEYLVKCLHEITMNGKGGGYGGMFYRWLQSNGKEPFNSFGNVSAMRVSPVAWFAKDINECLNLAKISAEVTHNHPEGIKGAQATAAAIFFNRIGKNKEFIKDYIEHTFEYNLSRKLEDIRPTYKFEVSCQKSVPESIICWLESKDYEDCIRKAVWMGGDTDTMAAIAGSICAANKETPVPDEMIEQAFDIAQFPENDEVILKVLDEFHSRFEI